MLTFCLLLRSNFQVKNHFLCVLGRLNRSSDLQFFYLNLFDTPFPRYDQFLAYIQTKLLDWREFFKKIAKFWSTKNGISETVRDRAKRTKIWDHKGQKSQITKSFKKIMKNFKMVDLQFCARNNLLILVLVKYFEFLYIYYIESA